MSSEQQERWEVRATPMTTGQYEVFRPTGKANEEGTQAIEVIATCNTWTAAGDVKNALNARLTDVQQDAGGRWSEQPIRPMFNGDWGAPLWWEDGQPQNDEAEYIERMESYAQFLESRLTEEQRARKRAEEERDEQADMIVYLSGCADYGTHVDLLERAEDAEAEVTRLRTQVERLEAAIRDIGACSICHGDGSPSCISCHNYQGCICRPGEGSKAEYCWSCGGDGLSKWARSATS